MPARESTVTWPLIGGIDTKKSPLMLEPGSFLTLDNVRMERLHEWKLRAGFAHTGADDMPNGLPPQKVVELPGGGAFAIVRETDAGSAMRVYSPSQASSRWQQPSTSAAAITSPSYWTRKPVSVATPSPSIATQAVSATGIKLVAWWSFASGGVTVALLTPEGIALPQPTGPTLGTATRPRATYVSSLDRLVVFYNDAGSLKASVWNGTTGAFVATTTIAADFAAGVGLSGVLDAITYGNSATATCVYTSTTGNNIHQVEFNPSTAAFTNTSLAIVCDQTASLLPDPDNSGLRFVALSNAVPEVRVVRTNSSATIQTNDLTDTVANVTQIAGCAYQAGAGWMIVYMTIGATGQLLAKKKRSGTITSSASQVTPQGHPITLDSNAWREPNTDAMHYIAGLHIGIGSSLGDFQHSYFEMALEYENGSTFVINLFTEPQARILPLNAGPGPNITGVGVWGMGAQVQRLAQDQFTVPLVRLARFDRAGGGPSSSYAVDTFTVIHNNLSLLPNVGAPLKGAQASYIPAGSLLQCVNGKSIVGHGGSAVAFQPTVADAGAGGNLSAGVYNYVIQVEHPDEGGNTWRSGVSIAVATASLAANHKVTVAIKATSLELSARIRKVKVWRTVANGSAYFLQSETIDTVANTNNLTITDNTSDALLNSSDALPADFYPNGNPTTVTPRFIHAVIWNGRMWGIEGDFPTRVWFSKTLRPGISPEFTAGQVLIVDDQYGDLTGMAALDDKLLLFKGTSVGMSSYSIQGDGPDDLLGGAAFTVTRFSSDVGSIAGTPIVSTGEEAYVVALRGVYRIKRSLEIDFVGAPIDQFINQPQVQTEEAFIGAVFDRETNEVRFQTTNYRLVYNRLWNLWYRDTGGVATAIVATATIGLVQYLFQSGGNVFAESSAAVDDAGTPIIGTIRSPWIKPANVEGRFRLYKGRVLAMRTTGSGSVSPTMTVFRDYDDTLFETKAPQAVIAPGTNPVRAEIIPRNNLITAFSFQLQLSQGDQLTRLEAWSAEIGILPGASKRPVSERWV